MDSLCCGTSGKASCSCRAAAVIATDKEDLVERVKEITGTACFPCRDALPSRQVTCCACHQASTILQDVASAVRWHTISTAAEATRVVYLYKPLRVCVVLSESDRGQT